MKRLSLVLLIIVAWGAHAQVPADAGLPSTGESAAPAVVDGPPVQNPKEFNQDIDDFEKKISKEVPAAPAKAGAKAAHTTPEPGPAPGSDRSAEKARAEMKKAHEASAAEDAQPKTGIAARKAQIAAEKKAAHKKPKKGAKPKKKTPAKKPKKKPEAE